MAITSPEASVCAGQASAKRGASTYPVHLLAELIVVIQLDEGSITSWLQQSRVAAEPDLYELDENGRLIKRWPWKSVSANDAMFELYEIDTGPIEGQILNYIWALSQNTEVAQNVARLARSGPTARVDMDDIMDKTSLKMSDWDGPACYVLKSKEDGKRKYKGVTMNAKACIAWHRRKPINRKVKKLKGDKSLAEVVDDLIVLKIDKNLAGVPTLSYAVRNVEHINTALSGTARDLNGLNCNIFDCSHTERVFSDFAYRLFYRHSFSAVAVETADGEVQWKGTVLTDIKQRARVFACAFGIAHSSAPLTAVTARSDLPSALYHIVADLPPIPTQAFKIVERNDDLAAAFGGKGKVAGNRLSRLSATQALEAAASTSSVQQLARGERHVTLVSLSLILSLTLYEFVDYRRVHMEPTIVVDKSRGEKLVVDLNITFPRVPCYLLSVDIMDISGEHQNDINHDMDKTRLAQDGSVIQSQKLQDLKGEAEKVAATRGPDYCGTCYGGAPPTEGPNPGCCNTCEEVRESYIRRGWSFVNPDSIEQCVKEGWTDKIKDQQDEGCNIAGKIRVNKVIGNFHLSPGRSFQANAQHVHDLVPYLQGGKKHDFGHVIHRLQFKSDTEDEFVDVGRRTLAQTKRDLGIVNPLDGHTAHTEESNYMFQYFLKVVSTKFTFLDGREVATHQYSVTSYERDCKTNKDEHGHQVQHGYSGVPGFFVNYEISPLMVKHEETRQSLAHFLTSTCAIVGGVLTIAGLVDSFVYAGRNRLKVGGAGGQGFGYARADGKMM